MLIRCNSYAIFHTFITFLCKKRHFCHNHLLTQDKRFLFSTKSTLRQFFCCLSCFFNSCKSVIISFISSLSFFIAQPIENEHIKNPPPYKTSQDCPSTAPLLVHPWLLYYAPGPYGSPFAYPCLQQCPVFILRPGEHIIGKGIRQCEQILQFSPILHFGNTTQNCQLHAHPIHHPMQILQVYSLNCHFIYLLPPTDSTVLFFSTNPINHIHSQPIALSFSSHPRVSQNYILTSSR